MTTGKFGVSKSTEYAALVAEAEASVAAVKDAELRRVAFEKILEPLLDRDQTKSKGQKEPVTSARKPVTARKAGKRSAGSVRQGPKGWPAPGLDDTDLSESGSLFELHWA